MLLISYDMFRQTSPLNLLSLPEPPISKNKPNSTENDSINMDRTYTKQLFQQRFKPNIADNDVVKALQIVNNNIV